MEDTVAILIVLFLLVGGYYFIRRRVRKNRPTRPSGPVRPEIPDHEAEKDGDVFNGKTFSSFSASFAPINSVTNAQRIENGVVIATQQIEQHIRESVLGSVIKSDNSLPEPLENYTFKATAFGEFINPPSEGNLGDMPIWAINHTPGQGRPLDPQPQVLIERPVHARVYLEIEAPEGYKGGVVILDLRIETGM